MIRFSKDSKLDLFDIASYTLDRWGAAQAYRYMDGFSQCFEQLDRMPGMGRACADLHHGLLRFEQGQHVVFYLPDPDGIFICRVLHRRMLPEDEDFIASVSESIED